MNNRLKWFQVVVWLELALLVAMFWGSLTLPSQIILLMAQARQSLIMDLMNPVPLIRMLGIGLLPTLTLGLVVVCNDPLKRLGIARMWVGLHALATALIVVLLNGQLPLVVWLGLALLIFGNGLLLFWLLETGLAPEIREGSHFMNVRLFLNLMRSYAREGYQFLRTRKYLRIGTLAVTLLVVGATWTLWFYMKPRKAVPPESSEHHFKYGAIGTLPGVPSEILRVLPEVFADRMPGTNGWWDFGLIVEAGHDLPIGFAVDNRRIPTATFNCALCHTSTARTNRFAERVIYPSAPAHQLELDHFIQFVVNCAEDPRFNAEEILSAIEQQKQLGLVERLIYQTAVIPGTRFALKAARQEMMWMRVRPDCGRGRIDAFNTLKFTILRLPEDATIGTADYMPLWDQRKRLGSRFHWDGSGNSLKEANHISALSVIFSPGFVDEGSLNQVTDYLLDLPSPRFPFEVDSGIADRGKLIYQRECARCHSFEGELVGKITPLSEVQTDAEYISVMTPLLASALDSYDTPPFDFQGIDLSAGYLNVPLNGCWLRAPYLHNGSIPTLWDLLQKVEDRPVRFYRGHDVYDPEKMGFVSDFGRAGMIGSDFSVRVRGNGNKGHLWGTDLTDAEKWALIEYLKTL